MRNSKAKKILFTFSVIAASLPFSGCKDEPTPTPIVVDSLKSGLVALNTSNNYTMNCNGSRIVEHTRIYLKDSISLLYKDDNRKPYNKIYYQDGDKGVYSIAFNGEKYVGSSYYTSVSNDVWSGKFYSTMKGVETDYVNGIADNAASVNITNKSYRTAFLKSVGYSAIDYVELDSLNASFNNGKLYFKMHFKNLDYNFIFSDFGTSTNTVLSEFLSGGGKPYELTKEHESIKSRMMLNNYEQYIYQFGDTPETTGYVGKNYFHPNYYYTNYFNSVAASGHIALDGRESASGTYKDIYGCYQFYLDYDSTEQPLTLYPTRFYEEPDIPTFYNYPSKMSLWDHMEYLLDWNTKIFDPIYDYPLQGKGYTITDPTLVYEIENNFGIQSSFDGAKPVAVGIDFYSTREAGQLIYWINFICKFELSGYEYVMPFPFFNFGQVDNALLNAAIEEMKL